VIRLAPARLVTAWLVNSRHSTGSSPSGGSTSRASTRVTATPAGSFAASAALLRFGRFNITVPARNASTTSRARRPGQAGREIVSRPSSRHSPGLSNSRAPSVSTRS
jgi:hypothetical protein